MKKQTKLTGVCLFRLEFEDTWGPYSEYLVGDIVTYGGYTYVAKTNNSENNSQNLQMIGKYSLQDLNPRGEWSPGLHQLQDYKTGDVVTLGGYTYSCNSNPKWH